ncbi:MULTISPECIES: lipid-A-disaccharide synthase [unclassified Moraxella]|uniref:lipid-A-disaccharide synthase n=1 Tax=unclassified Moraxella TaxID=2685852 RepID=UPI00359D79CD
MTDTLTIGIVAGEISGDALGADFMQQMNKLHPNICWVGVGGHGMIQMGLKPIIDMERLSVMGLAEVLKHLPDLFRAKKEILRAFDKNQIDIFIGIDAPDFNLRLGKTLKPKGVFCVQMVSPSIWAWRENRIHSIKAATNLVLCLFPFELPVYAKHHHPAVCIGHPLIHHTQPKNFTKSTNTLCLMAGSRLSEIRAILPTLLASFDALCQTHTALTAILPLAKDEHRVMVRAIINEQAPHLSSRLTTFTPSDWQDCSEYDSNYTASQYAMQVAKLTILASGTATLEALMLNTPMVVVYKVNALTYAIAKRLIKTPYVCLPNILAFERTGKSIVPELIQGNATAQNIAHEANCILANPNEQKNKLINTVQLIKQASSQNPADTVLSYYTKNN